MEFLINQFLKPVYPNKLVRNKQDLNMTKNPKAVYVTPTSLLGSINGSQTHTITPTVSRKTPPAGRTMNFINLLMQKR